MIWSLKIILFVMFLQVFYPATVSGLDCTGRCCYYYHGVPRNITDMSCNPEGSRISWMCQVYNPHDSSSTLSVKWYKSATEETARKYGQEITEVIGKYDFSRQHASLPISNNQSIVNGLFLDIFELTILEFDSNTDDGYYWCQLLINDTCLEPSDFGHIMLNSSLTRLCELNPLDIVEFNLPQVCALQSQCTSMVQSLTTQAEKSASTASEEQTTSHGGLTNSPLDEQSQVMSMVIVLYIIIGVLVLIILLLLLVILAFTVHTARNHKTFKLQQRMNIHRSEITDLSRQSMNIYDAVSQAEGEGSRTNTLENNVMPHIYHNISQSHLPQLGDNSASRPPISPPNDDEREPPPPPQSNNPHQTPSPPPTGLHLQPASDDFSRITDSTPEGQEGNYAYPRKWPALKFGGVSDSASRPPISGEYQDLRVSRLDYTELYDVADARKKLTEHKEDSIPKTKPNYVNVQA